MQQIKRTIAAVAIGAICTLALAEVPVQGGAAYQPSVTGGARDAAPSLAQSSAKSMYSLESERPNGASVQRVGAALPAPQDEESGAGPSAMLAGIGLVALIAIRRFLD